MSEWTIPIVASRFSDAASTARRLPPVRVQGYFSAWPEFTREAWEGFVDHEPSYRPIAPSPVAIERMLETMRWVQWLEVEQRHLVWMRAQREPWLDICRRLGCHRATAWRRWQCALQDVADRLNHHGRRSCVFDRDLP